MNVKISKHPSRILVTLSHFSRERPIYDCSQIRRSRLIGRCSERHWRATRNTNRSKTSREMISVGVQNCFSPTGDRPGSFRRIETNVVRPSLSLSLSFSIANENENEPLGCAIIHWRRWLRLRHTYRISSSSAAEPSNKTRQPEIRRISSELFFFFFPPSLPPSFLFSASFQAERSYSMACYKCPSNCSIGNEQHLFREIDDYHRDDGSLLCLERAKNSQRKLSSVSSGIRRCATRFSNTSLPRKVHVHVVYAFYLEIFGVIASRFLRRLRNPRFWLVVSFWGCKIFCETRGHS